MSAGPASELPLVVVTVGTDHHPFDRVVRWVDGWLADGGAARARCVVQHGTAAAPQHAEARPYIDHDEVSDLLRQASVVVSHGGPATISECRALGRVPVVVPRRPDLGEHVDDHQVLFTRRLAERGHVLLAASEEELRSLLDKGAGDRAAFAVTGDLERSLGESVRRFGELVAGLRPGARR